MTKDEIDALIASNVEDNTTKSITPQDVREVLYALNDAAFTPVNPVQSKQVSFTSDGVSYKYSTTNDFTTGATVVQVDPLTRDALGYIACNVTVSSIDFIFDICPLVGVVLGFNITKLA